MKAYFGLLILLTFIPLSSYSQFQWEHTSGPFGSFRSFVYANNIYAFIPSNDFLYRSDDGIQWEKLVHEVSKFMGVYHDTLVNSLQDKTTGLFHVQISYDNGINWEIKNLPIEITAYGDLVMCSHGIYLAQGFEGKIYRSIDLGDTWNPISAPDTFERMNVFEDRLYVSGDSLLWRTDQNGGNWADITPPLPHPLPFDEYVVDFVARDSHIVVTVDQSLFLSQNNGQSWDITYTSSNNSPDKMAMAGEYIYLNCLGALIRTNDFGIHWDTLVTHFYPRAINFTGLRDVLLVTTYDRGVLRWDESIGKILESNEGLSKGVVYDLAYGANKIWAACGNGVFVYDIPTGTWSDKMNLPLPRIETCFVSANDEGWVIYGEYYAEQFYLSDDQGATWDTIRPGFYINDMQLLHENIFMFSGRFLRSIDKGMNWDTLGFTVLSEEIIPFGDKMYVISPGSLQFTIDAGLTWNSLSTPVGFIKLYSCADKLYGLYSNSIDKTELYATEDAVHWNDADLGFPDIDIYTLYYHYHPLFFRDANYHYAFLGSLGHYISSDGGLSWSIIETTQTGKDYLIHDNIIYLGGEGVYKTQIENPFITASEEPSKSPGNLFTVLPNPVKEDLQINFNTGLDIKGLIKIYTSDGEMVKSMNLDESKGGVTISLQDLSGGMYYVVFTSEGAQYVNSFIKL